MALLSQVPYRAWTLAGVLGLAGSAACAAGVVVQVTDARGAPLADAVVYALPAAGKAPPAPAGARAIIDQIDREFVPLVSVMQTGTAVSFPNKDDVEHDVYSFSPAKRFEIRLYSGVPSKPVLFDKPGLVTIGCNIHDSMVAYVIVVDTPYFAKTDKAGRAVLETLPPGAWRVSAWHHAMRDPNAQPVQPVQTGAATGPALKFMLATETN
ncbi:MAG: methylamine utilization protein [Pseudomonadota bacterium]